MRGSWLVWAALTAVAGTAAPAQQAQPAPNRLPGDAGRSNGGIFPVNPPPQAATPAPSAFSTTPAPSMQLALRAAQAVAEACKQYPFGMAVVNAAGQPILVYVPDGSRPSHGYTAIRKAYSAISFKVNSSQMVTRAQSEAPVQAQIAADANLLAYSGGVLVRKGGETIGAIGVSGAEPGRHDEECALKGLAAIAQDLR